MPFRPLSENEVQIRIKAIPEEIPVQGNACFSGDSEFDQQIEQIILDRLRHDDVWAWAMVGVSVDWEDLEATEYLGCCSYDSEEDFRNNSGYYEDMLENALFNLNQRLQQLHEKMSSR